MSWITAIAVYFIIWFVTLFAVIPFGLRTQRENDDVTLGTTESAPAGPHMLRAVIRTSIVAAVIFAIYYWLTQVQGFSVDSIPRIVPSGS